VRQSSVPSFARLDRLSVKIPIILFFLCGMLLCAVPATTALVPPLTSPIADFTYDFVHVAGPGGEPTWTIIVDASASSDPDGIRSYNLSWGDGTQETSSAPLIMHTYSSAGLYQVTLTVTDTTGQSGSISKRVPVTSVKPEPTTPGTPIPTGTPLDPIVPVLALIAGAVILFRK